MSPIRRISFKCEKSFESKRFFSSVRYLFALMTFHRWILMQLSCSALVYCSNETSSHSAVSRSRRRPQWRLHRPMTSAIAIALTVADETDDLHRPATLAASPIATHSHQSHDTNNTLLTKAIHSFVICSLKCNGLNSSWDCNGVWRPT